MLNHLLVPLDGSQLAEQALDYARQIVKPGGRITLLSVVDLPFPTQVVFDMPPVQTIDPATLEQHRDLTKRYLQGKAATLASAGFVVDTIVELGYPEEAIVSIARKYAVDAIVMSTHGRTGLNRMLMGSVTHRVLNDTPCPVFVVPNLKRQTATSAKNAS
jgi:nucleotide-binding universal stress UspA family protein